MHILAQSTPGSHHNSIFMQYAHWQHNYAISMFIVDMILLDV